jgi:hypothetical protein
LIFQAVVNIKQNTSASLQDKKQANCCIKSRSFPIHDEFWITQKRQPAMVLSINQCGGRPAAIIVV